MSRIKLNFNFADRRKSAIVYNNIVYTYNSVEVINVYLFVDYSGKKLYKRKKYRS